MKKRYIFSVVLVLLLIMVSSVISKNSDQEQVDSSNKNTQESKIQEIVQDEGSTSIEYEMDEYDDIETHGQQGNDFIKKDNTISSNNAESIENEDSRTVNNEELPLKGVEGSPTPEEDM